MYASRNKTDLIIEVWEKLDCESVGAREISAIETAVRDRFGRSAVDSPMTIARLLADEGAELRHSELMQLYVERHSNLPYDPELRNIISISGFRNALASLRNIENLRRKYASDGDKEGLRLVREKAKKAREEALLAAADRRLDTIGQQKNAEIAEWITLWLHSPELFENWVALRLGSADFRAKFGDILEK